MARRSPELLGVDAVLGEHVVDRRPADVERPGSPADIASTAHEGIDEEAALALIPRLFERGQRLDDGGGVEVEVSGPDDPAGGHDDGPVDLVFELADVPRPQVLDDGLERLGTEARSE